MRSDMEMISSLENQERTGRLCAYRAPHYYFLNFVWSQRLGWYSISDPWGLWWVGFLLFRGALANAVRSNSGFEGGGVR